MNFVLLNEGTSASRLTAQCTPEWLATCAAALQVQLNRDVAPAWGGSYGVRVGLSAADIAPGETVFSLVDTLPDAPDAIAYHSVDGAAAPFGLLALTMCQTLNDVSGGASHEFCETAGDAGCNEWADDSAGSEWARELCDAVESWSYVIDGIVVSDFVLPNFFVPRAPGPYHYLATLGQVDLMGPFVTAHGGYQIKRPAGGGEIQINGFIRAHRFAHKAHWSSRSHRRGLRL